MNDKIQMTKKISLANLKMLGAKNNIYIENMAEKRATKPI
jgi:hypothetical protein